MTDLVEDFNISLNHPGEDDLTQMRENWKWLLMCALLTGVRDQKKCIYAPGWTTTVISTSSPLNYDQPESITVSKTYTDTSPNETWTYQFLLTWTGTNLTTIVCQFSDGTTSPEFTTVTEGTITCSYDGSGNLTGATSA
jgi:hypothetical protein